MAYVKNVWEAGDVVTSAKLNHIEDGIQEAGESSKAIILTQVQYDALSEEEKNSDNVYYISDAPFDSPNVVTLTKAEYDALSNATKMDGRFYYVTDEAEVATTLVAQTNQNSTETVPSSAVVYSGLAAKVNTADIVDDLTTSDATKPLSAKQGKALNDSLSLETYTLTSEYFSTIKLLKRAGVVTLLLMTVATSTALNTSSDYVDYFTIPAGFRPNDSLYWRFYSVYSSTRSLFTIRINSNGVVSLFNHDGVQHPGMAQTFTFVQRY